MGRARNPPAECRVTAQRNLCIQPCRPAELLGSVVHAKYEVARSPVIKTAMVMNRKVFRDAFRRSTIGAVGDKVCGFVPGTDTETILTTRRWNHHCHRQ